MSRSVPMNRSGRADGDARAARRMAMALALGTVVAGMLSPLGSGVARADATWTGATSQDWNVGTNWGTNPPAGNFFINTATGNYPVLNANSAFTPVDLILGDGGGQSGQLDQSAGTLSLANTGTSGNWMFVGRGGGTGTYNLTGTGSLAVGKMWVGGVWNAEGGTGTVNMNTTGSVTANSTDANGGFGGQISGSVIVGWASFPSGSSNATFNLQNGTLNANGGGLWVGAWGSTSTFNMTGGTVNASSLSLGRWFSASSTMNVSNGTVNNGGTTTLAHSGSASDNNHATMNVNAGGTLNSEGDFVAAFAGDGVNNGSAGQLNIAAGGTVNVATTTKRWFIVNQWDTVQGQVNVNGGTLNLNANTDLRFSTGNGTGTSVVNLNSGAITSWSGNTTGATTSGVVDMNRAGGTGANNTFNLNGGTLSVSQVVATSTNGTAAFNFNGGTLQATNDGANFVKFGGASQVANVRNGGAIIDSNGHNVTVVQPLMHSGIAGDNATDGGLTKTGAGTLTLTGNHTYNGDTTVNGGILAVANGSLASSVTVASGNSFAASATASIPSLSFAGAGTLGFDLGTQTAAAGVAPVLSITNALTIGNGAVSLNVAHTGPISSGTYNLASLGSLAGTPSNLVLGSIQGFNAARQTATLNESNSALTLTIVGAVPIWHGATNTNWSTSTSDGAWNVNGTDSYFLNGDDVQFDDTAASPNVTVVGTVTPNSIMFNNNALNYTVGGTGTIGGNGTLNTKLGSGSLTINTANTYSGGTTLGGGQLNINNNTALGTGALTTSGAATVDNTSGADVTTTNAVSLGGDLTVAGTNDLAFNGPISGNGVGLIKNGPANLGLGGNNTYTGTTVIHGGTVTVTAGTTGTTAANIQIAPAIGDVGTLTVSGGTLNASRVVIAGASTNDTSPGTGVLNQSGGTINSNAWFTVGSGGSANGNTGGTGTYNLTGGTLNVMTQQMEVGNFAGATGTVNMSGASSAINIYNNNFISLGANNDAGSGTFNQNGGSVTFYSDAGTTPGGTGVLYLGKAGALTGTYTYNLNGGTLTVPQITHSAGTGVFNFDGGTLRAAADQTAFLGNLTTANVRNGGAIIDTNGHNVTVAQPLVHSTVAGDNATDGGLTKNGAGTMVLSGVSTYTGATVINGGTVRLPSGQVPAPVGSYSFDNVVDQSNNSVTGGGLAQGITVKNDGTGGSAMDGTVNHADNLLDSTNGTASLATGKFGNALSLDGLGSSVDVANRIVDQSGTGSWTTSMWIQTSTPGSAMLSKNHGASSWQGGDAVFYLATNPISGNGGNLPTAVRYGGGFVQGDPSPASVTDGNWHMLTYVDNGGTKTVYVDGQPVTMTMTNFDNADSTTQVRLGYNTDNLSNLDGNFHFSGLLDEVKFYGAALTPAQVQQLFTSNAVTYTGGQQYLPTGTAVRLAASDSALDLNDNNQTVGSLQGVAGSSVTLGVGTLTAGGDGTSTTFAGTIAGSGGITKMGAGTWTLTGANTYAGRTTVNAGKVVLGPAAASVVSSGGGAAVNAGRLVFDYAGGSSPAGTLVPLVQASAPSGFTAGKFTSSGIDSTHTLGYLDNAGTSTFTVMLTYYGDLNLDGTINGDDYALMDRGFAKHLTGWVNGDVNYDGSVTPADYLLMDTAYGHQSGGVLSPDFLATRQAEFGDAYVSALVAAVPEPTGLGLVATGVVGLIGRRRRRIA